MRLCARPRHSLFARWSSLCRRRREHRVFFRTGKQRLSYHETFVICKPVVFRVASAQVKN